MDIPSKIYRLQWSWIEKLYDQNSHDWKLIPMHFISDAFRKNSIFFYSNLNFKTSVLHQFPTFYANILQSCKINFSHSYTPSCIGSQFLWFNNYIRIDNNSADFKGFFES